MHTQKPLLRNQTSSPVWVIARSGSAKIIFESLNTSARCLRSAPFINYLMGLLSMSRQSWTQWVKSQSLSQEKLMVLRLRYLKSLAQRFLKKVSGRASICRLFRCLVRSSILTVNSNIVAQSERQKMPSEPIIWNALTTSRQWRSNLNNLT